MQKSVFKKNNVVKSKFLSNGYSKEIFIVVFFAVLIAISIILNFTFNSELGFKVNVPFDYLETKGEFCSFVISIILVFFTSIHLICEMIESFKEHKVGVDFLALLSLNCSLFVRETIGKITIGGYISSLIICLMVASGELLEKFAGNQAKSSLEKVYGNSPKLVHVLKDDGDFQEVPSDEIEPKTKILVKTGELIPIDSKLFSDNGYFDTSSITGEPEPITLKKGDHVLSGYLNLNKAVVLETVRKAEQSQMQLINKILSKSNSQKSKIIKMADIYALPFTLISLLLASICWIICYLTSPSYSNLLGFTRFTEILVLASPCPLLIAAPVAFLCGKSKAASYGIVVKKTQIMEDLAKARAFCFDKTGTVTDGELSLCSVTCLDKGISKEDLIQYVYSLECLSNHVFAKALSRYSSKIKRLNADGFKEYIGEGIEGIVEGKMIKIGRASFVGSQEKDLNQTNKLTTIYVSINGKTSGYLTFKDQIKNHSKSLVYLLKKSGVSKTYLITGDNKQIADEVGKKIDIDEVYANFLPIDKVKTIKALKENNSPLVMVGDGINDAPSMKEANIGMAFYKGTSSLTSETADIVLLNKDVLNIYYAYSISKLTIKKAKNSIFIGMGLCLLFMLIALTGYIPSFIGAIIQETIDLISISYALTVLLFKPEKANLFCQPSHANKNSG